MSAPDPAQFLLFPGHCAQAPAAAPPPRAPASSAAPPLRLCVLGSGSGGNCTAIHWNSSLFLIDLGFGPATIARRLTQAGLAPENIAAVCLTHLDQDHFRPHWIPTLLGWKIHLFLHRWHLEQFCLLDSARDLYDAGLVHVFDHHPFDPIPSAPGIPLDNTSGGSSLKPQAASLLTALPIHLPHDLKGTSGFLISTPAGSIGYATDLGCVPPELIDRFAGVDLLAIESNYDPQMQMGSSRPLFLKRRIMGQAGHLSNQQAFDAVRAIAARSDFNGASGGPAQVVLLHRSRQCNTPEKIRETFAQDPALARRIVLTEQRRRSRWFHVRPRPAPVRAQMALPLA